VFKKIHENTRILAEDSELYWRIGKVILEARRSPHHDYLSEDCFSFASDHGIGFWLLDGFKAMTSKRDQMYTSDTLLISPQFNWSRKWSGI
jgi:hypothetical protein